MHLSEVDERGLGPSKCTFDVLSGPDAITDDPS